MLQAIGSIMLVILPLYTIATWYVTKVYSEKKGRENDKWIIYLMLIIQFFAVFILATFLKNFLLENN